ncbi:tRNA (adenine-N(1)-)-methyltransferase [Thermaerobacter marianensis DSM 12885]|uniref:tRNA (Adenine-N(1)-)-methyltransferase n=1 Tax=Thermaerobacter marianensis (strain ATCC 700841 / DSM 12885 / JCM 10246 / 7p75a) TaxID=644966 RepID=E6SL54_THEM7|nr:tRNA (adenine-N(1)-)-methyltransferase [Thermaerobacter marianensis DSM 12885]
MTERRDEWYERGEQNEVNEQDPRFDTPTSAPDRDGRGTLAEPGEPAGDGPGGPGAPGDRHRAWPVPRGPLAMGELVVFVDAKLRRRLQRLRPGRVFQAPAGGIVRHESVAGLPEGSSVTTSTGGRLWVLRPTLEEYVLAMPRRTQVIYPKDLGQIVVRSNLGPGGRVLEAGVGSGATTLALLRAVGPAGRVISYERRPEFARLARENVERFFGSLPPWWQVEIRDVYQGIDERDLDAVVLDVPEPFHCVDSAARALRPGGVLLCWLPTTNQVQELVTALRRHPAWDLIETVELLLRPWHVTAASVRPEHRMVAHTGFLVTARRVVPASPGEAARDAGAEREADVGEDEAVGEDATGDLQAERDGPCDPADGAAGEGVLPGGSPAD